MPDLKVALPHLCGDRPPAKAILRTLETVFMKAFLCCLAASRRAG
jgi:hypothetical protein